MAALERAVNFGHRSPAHKEEIQVSPELLKRRANRTSRSSPIHEELLCPASGFRAKFVSPVPDELLCTLCFLPLRDPMQAGCCGHRFCRMCIEPFLKKNPGLQCPAKDCTEVIPTVHKDKRCEREVLALRVLCDYRENCSWIGELRDLEGHVNKCSSATVFCPNADLGCTEKVLKSELDHHVNEDCGFTRVICFTCQHEFPRKNLKAHEQECITDFQRDKYLEKPFEKPSLHHSIGYEMVDGCEKWTNEAAHEWLPDSHHPMTSSAKSSEETFNAVVDIESLSCENLQLNKRMEDVGNRIDTLVTANLSRRLELLIGNLETCKKRGMAENQTLNYEYLERQSNEISRRSDTALAEQHAVNERLNAILPELGRLERHLNQQHTIFTRCDAILAEFSQRVRFLETSGGESSVLVWKIDNFSHYLAQAKSGEKTALSSPPLLVGRFGYQVSMRAYLNGDGSALGNFLSLYLVILKGEFDNILVWPFQQKVTLGVMDQSSERRHIRETFLPDPSSSSFQKPTTQMNLGSGCPRLASHAVLRTHGYTSDDSMYLWLAIDMTGL